MELNRVARKGYCAQCFMKADLQCAKCGEVNYCSSNCQRKHWALSHKGDCGFKLPAITEIPVPDSPYNSENAVVLDKTWRKLCPTERNLPQTVRGLRNLGNTCFVNSSLQMILRIPHLVSYLQQENFEPGTLHATLKELYNELLASPTDDTNGDDDKDEDSMSEERTSSFDHDWLSSRRDSRGEQRRRLKEDKYVVLCGLKDEKLNGHTGTLLGLEENSGRYKVKMFDDTIKLVKRDNLLRAPWSPQDVCNCLPKLAEFNFGEQEDAHEFIWSLMRALEKEEIQAFEKRRNIASAPLGVEYSSIPHRSFGGLFMSETICPKCSAINHTSEHFQFLSLSIDNEFVHTLEEALTMFTAPERLDKQNRYSCGSCNKYVRARKRITVYSTSPCLLIQIKRFTIMGRGKISKKLKFPVELNLSPFKIDVKNADTGASEYTLMAVIVHLDSGSSFYGHYICYAVGPLHSVGLAGGSVWYRLDDGKVVPVSEAEVLNAEAYLLLYESDPRREKDISSFEQARVPSKEPSSENRERCLTKDCEFAAGPTGLCSKCAGPGEGNAERPPSMDEDKISPDPKSNPKSADQSDRIPEKKEEKRQEPELSGQAKKKKVGPNDPCLCGSGKKYKKCHGSKK